MHGRFMVDIMVDAMGLFLKRGTDCLIMVKKQTPFPFIEPGRSL